MSSDERNVASPRPKLGDFRLLFYHLHSTAWIKRPVLPPILPSVELTPLAAPLSAGPAAEVTRVRPSEALLWMLETGDLAVDVASEAASVAFCVVDALRRHV